MPLEHPGRRAGCVVVTDLRHSRYRTPVNVKEELMAALLIGYARV